MPHDHDAPDELLDHVGTDRRQFVKRLVIGSAFATPVVSSFSMSGVNSVFAQDTNVSGQGPDVGSSDSENTDGSDGEADGGTTDDGTTDDGGLGNTDDGGLGNTDDGGTGNVDDGTTGNIDDGTTGNVDAIN